MSRLVQVSRRNRIVSNCLNTIGFTATEQFRHAHEPYSGINCHANDMLNEDEYCGLKFNDAQKTVLYYCFPDGIRDRVNLVQKAILCQWYFDDLKDSTNSEEIDNSLHDIKSIIESAIDENNCDIDENINCNADHDSISTLDGLYKLFSELKDDSDSLWLARYVNNYIISHEHQNNKLHSLSKDNYIYEYMDHRLHDGGLLPVFDLSEYVHNSYLYDFNTIQQHVPSLYLMRKYGAIHFSLSNDLHGYMHEIDHAKNLLNIVWKYKYNENDDNFTDAILDSINLINNIFEYLLELNEKVFNELDTAFKNKLLSSNDSDAVEKYTKSIIDICISEHHWSVGPYGGRYQSNNHFFTDMR